MEDSGAAPLDPANTYMIGQTAGSAPMADGTCYMGSAVVKHDSGVDICCPREYKCDVSKGFIADGYMPANGMCPVGATLVDDVCCTKNYTCKTEDGFLSYGYGPDMNGKCMSAVNVDGTCCTPVCPAEVDAGTGSAFPGLAPNIGSFPEKNSWTQPNGCYEGQKIVKHQSGHDICCSKVYKCPEGFYSPGYPSSGGMCNGGMEVDGSCCTPICPDGNVGTVPRPNSNYVGQQENGCWNYERLVKHEASGKDICCYYAPPCPKGKGFTKTGWTPIGNDCGMAGSLADGPDGKVCCNYACPDGSPASTESAPGQCWSGYKFVKNQEADANICCWDPNSMPLMPGAP
jgi:hypothetical protein